jgi:leader peptidase (prepilin peptidase)/N-methyltransferase
MPESANIFPLMPLIFLMGISVGSFVTMASYRLPLNQKIVFGPSYCTHCRKPLGVLDLLPLVSWLWQKGRCRHCHEKISARYPVIELCMGLGFLAIGFLYGINVNSVLLALLLTELAILIVTDLEHYLIPDEIQIALLLTGVVYRIYNNSEWEDIFTGMAAGLTLGLILHYGYFYLCKKDGLGFGDVKFLCVAGCWLPLPDFIPFLFFGGLIGVLTGLFWRFIGQGKVFPFGPALAISLLINVWFPDILHRFVI